MYPAKNLSFLAVATLALAALWGALSTHSAPVELPDPPPVPWVDEQVHGDIFYFLYSHPARIERFDLQLRHWLTQVQLPQTPSSFFVDDEAFYVGFRTGEVKRFDHSGGEVVELPSHSEEVDKIFVNGDFAYSVSDHSTTSGEVVKSAVKWTGVQVDSSNYYDSMRGLDLAPGLARAFGIVEGRIGYIELLPYGMLGDQVDNYNDPLYGGNQTWVFPDETLVAADSGQLVHADDLALAGTLGFDYFEDLDFHGDTPIVLRGERIVAYSPAFVRTDEIETGLYGRRIAVHGDQVAVVHLGNTGIEVSWFPVPGLGLDPFGEPVQPEGLSYDVDGVVLDHRNIVYLLSRDHHSVFRFSVDQGRYLETIPLAGGAKHMTYVPDWDRLYLGYHLGQISTVQLEADGTPGDETPHLAAAGPLRHLTNTGDYLVVAESNGSSLVTHTTYDRFGIEVSRSATPRIPSSGFEWCDATRRLYFTGTGVSPIDLFYEIIDVDGQIGLVVDSLYDGEAPMMQPIHARADGGRVLLGSGGIFDGVTMDLIGELGNTHLDAMWWGSSIVTLAESGSEAALRLYGGDFTQQDAATLAGNPLAVLPIGDDVLVVTSVQNRPRFSRWSQTLTSEDLWIVVTDGRNIADGGSSVTYSVDIGSRGPIHAGVQITGFDSGHLRDPQWSCVASGGSACGVTFGTGSLDDVAYVTPSGTLHYEITGTVGIAAAGTLRVTVRAQPPGGREYSDSDLTQVHTMNLIFRDGFDFNALDAWIVEEP